MSVLTSMDGGLEAAIGVHAANNLFFFFIIGENGLEYLPSWLFAGETSIFPPKTLLIEIVFYFLMAFILAHWRVGLKEIVPKETL